MPPEDRYANLEIRIFKREAEGYPVELTLDGAQQFQRAYLKPDILLWVPGASPEKDGERLFNQLFATDQLRGQWAEIRGQKPKRRIRLRIDAEAPELHTLPWELLHDASPGREAQTLAADAMTPFSRHLASQLDPGQPLRQRPLKLLLAIANPRDLAEFGLPAIDVAGEQELVEAALSPLSGQVALHVLAEPVTLAALEEALRQGVDLLHIVAHGKFNPKNQTSVLYLTDEENDVSLVKASALARLLNHLAQKPRFIFLASCETAKRSDADALRGFAPRLIAAGIPAVLAMQDLIQIKTARKFSQIFYRQLLEHGQVDLASNEARAALLTANLPGGSIPVLFSRLPDNRLLDHTINPYQHLSPQPIDPKTLAQAEARLAEMPLDHLPEPAGALPPGSYMPLSRNPLFVDREGALQALARTLQGGGTAAIGQIMAATTGMGGIGKTQLASEFVHRYGPYFAGGVFWVSLAEPEAVPAEIAKCGPYLHRDQPGYSERPLEEQVAGVLAAWGSKMPRLLVFDNCEDEGLLAQWRPPSGGCRVLVTGRRGMWSRELGVEALPLDVLPRPESMALLGEHRPDLAEGVRNDIAAELGDLPLALNLAGRYLDRYRHAVKPEVYLAQLRAEDLLQHPSLKGRGADWSPTKHDLDVGRTFALSYERLETDDPIDALALALLSRAAYFAPGEPIPRDLLLKTLDLPAKPGLWARLKGLFRQGKATAASPEPGPAGAYRAEDALSRLVALGLLESEAEGSLRLHRLLVAFVRQAAPEVGAQEAVEEALLAQANRLNNAGYPAPLLLWQGHLRAVTDRAAEREDERGAGLCNELGYHLDMIADYEAARPYYERALAIREKVLGAEHPATATSLNNLGALLYAMGEYEAARPYYERALAIREKVLGAEHPDTATSLNNLGALLYAMGEYEAARPYFERALAIWEKVLGAEHPDTATSLNNLGALLYAMGEYEAARPYYERALAIFEAKLGPDHPSTRTVRGNLAGLEGEMGEA